MNMYIDVYTYEYVYIHRGVGMRVDRDGLDGEVVPLERRQIVYLHIYTHTSVYMYIYKYIYIYI